MNPARMAEIERRARRARAEYVGALLGEFVRRLAQFGRRIREIAAACTAARLRHN